jgi:hypothetical protein
MQKKQPKLIAVITPLIDHFSIFNADVFHSNAAFRENGIGVGNGVRQVLLFHKKSR